MKRTTLLILVIMSYTTSNLAQTSDFALIEEKLNYYLDGVRNNDIETARKAFHKMATMKFIEDDTYVEVVALDAFESNFGRNPSREGMTTRINDINITGNAAGVRLEIEFPTFIFIDYLNLLKIDDEWIIVDKVYATKMK